jgi:hypothetical protein
MSGLAAPVADVAELARASVMDRCEGRHAGIGHRRGLAADELALERGK